LQVWQTKGWTMSPQTFEGLHPLGFLSKSSSLMELFPSLLSLIFKSWRRSTHLFCFPTLHSLWSTLCLSDHFSACRIPFTWFFIVITEWVTNESSQLFSHLQEAKNPQVICLSLKCCGCFRTRRLYVQTNGGNIFLRQIKDRCDHTEPNRADSVKQTLTRASDIKQSLSSDLILANSVILRADTSLPLLSSVVRRVRKKTKNADSFTRLAFISVTDHGAETKGCRCNQAVPVPQLLFTNWKVGLVQAIIHYKYRWLEICIIYSNGVFLNCFVVGSAAATN